MAIIATITKEQYKSVPKTRTTISKYGNVHKSKSSRLKEAVETKKIAKKVEKGLLKQDLEAKKAKEIAKLYSVGEIKKANEEINKINFKRKIEGKNIKEVTAELLKDPRLITLPSVKERNRLKKEKKAVKTKEKSLAEKLYKGMLEAIEYTPPYAYKRAMKALSNKINNKNTKKGSIEKWAEEKLEKDLNETVIPKIKRLNENYLRGNINETTYNKEFKTLNETAYNMTRKAELNLEIMSTDYIKEWKKDTNSTIARDIKRGGAGFVDIIEENPIYLAPYLGGGYFVVKDLIIDKNDIITPFLKEPIVSGTTMAGFMALGSLHNAKLRKIDLKTGKVKLTKLGKTVKTIKRGGKATIEFLPKLEFRNVIKATINGKKVKIKIAEKYFKEVVLPKFNKFMNEKFKEYLRYYKPEKAKELAKLDLKNALKTGKVENPVRLTILNKKSKIPRIKTGNKVKAIAERMRRTDAYIDKKIKRITEKTKRKTVNTVFAIKQMKIEKYRKELRKNIKMFLKWKKELLKTKTRNSMIKATRKINKFYNIADAKAFRLRKEISAIPNMIVEIKTKKGGKIDTGIPKRPIRTIYTLKERLKIGEMELNWWEKQKRLSPLTKYKLKKLYLKPYWKIKNAGPNWLKKLAKKRIKRIELGKKSRGDNQLYRERIIKDNKVLKNVPYWKIRDPLNIKGDLSLIKFRLGDRRTNIKTDFKDSPRKAIHRFPNFMKEKITIEKKKKRKWKPVEGSKRSFSGNFGMNLTGQRPKYEVIHEKNTKPKIEINEKGKIEIKTPTFKIPELNAIIKRNENKIKEEQKEDTRRELNRENIIINEIIRILRPTTKSASMIAQKQEQEQLQIEELKLINKLKAITEYKRPKKLIGTNKEEKNYKRKRKKRKSKKRKLFRVQDPWERIYGKPAYSKKMNIMAVRKYGTWYV